MIHINEAFETVCRLINKQAYTAYKDFNRFWKQAELQLFKERLGLPEEYQPGKPLPRVAASMTQKISDDLRPFIKELTLVIDSNGAVPFPADYARTIAVSANNEDVAIIEQSMLRERRNSRISPPTKKYPIVSFYPDRLQFYPVDVATGTFEYYRFPVSGEWAFTLDGNGRPVYNEAGSKHSEFPKDCMNDLIIRVCSMFGVNLKASDVLQYAEQKQRQGI